VQQVTDHQPEPAQFQEGLLPQNAIAPEIGSQNTLILQDCSIAQFLFRRLGWRERTGGI